MSLQNCVAPNELVIQEYSNLNCTNDTFGYTGTLPPACQVYLQNAVPLTMTNNTLKVYFSGCQDSSDWSTFNLGSFYPIPFAQNMIINSAIESAPCTVMKSNSTGAQLAIKYACLVKSEAVKTKSKAMLKNQYNGYKKKEKVNNLMSVQSCDNPNEIVVINYKDQHCQNFSMGGMGSEYPSNFSDNGVIYNLPNATMLQVIFPTNTINYTFSGFPLLQYDSMMNYTALNSTQCIPFKSNTSTVYVHYGCVTNIKYGTNSGTSSSSKVSLLLLGLSLFLV
ncbi:hypothetical protein HDV04_000805 [Boothiomyces sp. JEL0838]|nr:hypothetical protein HDV04_000805 [Boothiomyces sp. JEL0838]